MSRVDAGVANQERARSSSGLERMSLIGTCTD